MDFNILFDQRNVVADNLKEYLRKEGYTKVSFANKVGISRPTLDKLLDGSIDSKSTFDKHLNKILETLNIKIDDLINFSNKTNNINNFSYAVFSDHTPSEYEMNSKTKEQYELLMNIIDICSIYY